MGALLQDTGTWILELNVFANALKLMKQKISLKKKGSILFHLLFIRKIIKENGSFMAN